MATILNDLYKKKLIHPPDFVISQLQYLAQIGSVSYGVSTDKSDIDLVGMCVPNKDMVFPHLAGEIQGFGKQKQWFKQWQMHHVQDNGKSYDMSVYNIVQFFDLCMANNPNMLDALFVPRRCVLYSTQLMEHIRSNRKVFLHAGAYHKFSGYAYSQLNKMKNKVIMSIIEFEKQFGLENQTINFKQVVDEIEWRQHKGKKKDRCLIRLSDDDLQGYRILLSQCKEPTKRKQNILKNGIDIKCAYHIVRLLGECEQVLSTGDLDIELDKERLKAIRNGEWDINKIMEFFSNKEKTLAEQYANTKIPYKPDENRIKTLLLECLEVHFGNLDKCISNLNKESDAIRKIKEIVGKL